MASADPENRVFEENPSRLSIDAGDTTQNGGLPRARSRHTSFLLNNNSTVDFNPGPLNMMSSVPDAFSLPLSWWNLSYRVGDVQILDGLTGTALPGRCLAIMGSSGAGKTTFLNAICDRLASGGAIKLSGSRQLGDIKYERRFRKALGFVTQDDILSPMGTPYDAIWFALRTRRGTDRVETHERVMELLETLRLTHCKDTIVGIPGLVTGLSGGERKRCSIGVELVSDPKVLLLDEPTSGLDSVTSAKLVKQLRELARVGRTIIYTIHQPTAEVLSSFDDLMLLTGGRCAYHGTMADSLDYFESIGFKCPEHYTAGDYFMKLLQDERTSHVIVERWEQHLKKGKRTPHTTSIRLAVNPNESTTAKFLKLYIKKFGRSSLIQLNEVFFRRVKEIMRDRLFIISLGMQELFFSIIVGLIFLHIGKDIESIQDRTGLLFMVVVNRAFSSVFTILNSFYKVRPVFMREQNAGAYSPLVYFVGTMTAQSPPMIFFCLLECIIIYFLAGLYISAGAFFLYFFINVLLQEVGVGVGFLLSACFESITVASSIVPLILVPLNAAGGLFASVDRLRPYWYELEKLSFIRHGFILLMRSEFKRLDHIDCNVQKYGELFCLNQPHNGKDVLMNIGFDSDPQSKSLYMWLSLIILWVLLRIFCVIALTVVSRQKSS
ncbi:unnamed protein product [Phytomonas sp. EM1]|nr:unnamed protein product [Phytomonas sp. EM1]|eukprot:CCW65175.1 unnamed protein product [Phytomonas sp. isolate EM1]